MIELENVGEQAKDLMKRLISKLEYRLKSDLALKHEWFKVDKEDLAQRKREFCQALDNFTVFKTFHKFKKVVLTYIASQISDAEIPQLGKVFKSLDENGDGIITIQEMEKAFEQVFGLDVIDIEEIMKAIDTDGSGNLNYTEFIAANLDEPTFMSTQNLKAAFKMFDKDGSGLIQAEELVETVGNHVEFGDGEVKWDLLLKEVDENGDGTIDFEEFVSMMEKA